MTRAEGDEGPRRDERGVTQLSGRHAGEGNGEKEMGDRLPPNPYGVFDKAKRLLSRSGEGGGDGRG